MTYTLAMQLVFTGLVALGIIVLLAAAWVDARANARAEKAREAEERRHQHIIDKIDGALTPSQMHQAAKAIGEAAELLQGRISAERGRRQ